jgi:hypothetical protein
MRYCCGWTSRRWCRRTRRSRPGRWRSSRSTGSRGTASGWRTSSCRPGVDFTFETVFDETLTFRSFFLGGGAAKCFALVSAFNKTW